jgi:hypothetical protein
MLLVITAVRQFLQFILFLGKSNFSAYLENARGEDETSTRYSSAAGKFPCLLNSYKK